jgi:hypothetical protein
MKTHKEIFTEIYDKNIWGGSGGGSSPENTVEYRALLQKFLKEKRIRSVVDFGCGDWAFSHLIDWSGVQYMGYDCVASVINENRRRHAAPNISFSVYRNDYVWLPPADLLIIKDVLQHWSNEDIDDFFFVYTYIYPTSFKYILITNSGDQETDGQDITTGQTRSLSAKFLPLKKYNPEIIAVIKTTITSEVSLITNV